MNDLALTPIRETSVRRRPEGYRIKHTTGIWWRDKLGSLLWKLLHKIGALEQYWFNEKIYHYGAEQQGKIADLIEEQILQVIDRHGRVEDHCIVLGGKDFADIMRSYEPFGLITVGAGRMSFGFASGYRCELRGLPVHVVPYLRGVAVLPKVIVEKRMAA